MSRHAPFPFRYALFPLCVSVLLPVLACGDGDGDGSPTSPGGATATLSGTLVRGTSVGSFAPRSEPIGLVGVTVRVANGSSSTVTDGAGRFTLTGLRGDEVELAFERADIHARGRVALVAGTHTTVTIAIVGDGIQTSPRGHAGEEIEGLVQAVDAGELTVLDQRLGAVTVLTDGSTLIRRGDTPIALDDIAVGNRVHVKAMEQDDGTYLATEILLQGDHVGGSRSFSGSIVSIDDGGGSFVVHANDTDITVDTNGSTRFHRRGGPASFGDLAVGGSVEVRGTLQGDGSVLATKVTIES